MSSRSSVREALERRAAIQAVRPKSSDIRANLVLKAASVVPQPVALAIELKKHGLSLKQAHAVLEEIASGKSTKVELRAHNLQSLVEVLASLGVEAHRSDQLAHPQMDIF